MRGEQCRDDGTRAQDEAKMIPKRPSRNAAPVGVC